MNTNVADIVGEWSVQFCREWGGEGEILLNNLIAPSLAKSNCLKQKH